MARSERARLNQRLRPSDQVRSQLRVGEGLANCGIQLGRLRGYFFFSGADEPSAAGPVGTLVELDLPVSAFAPGVGPLPASLVIFGLVSASFDCACAAKGTPRAIPEISKHLSNVNIEVSLLLSSIQLGGGATVPRGRHPYLPISVAPREARMVRKAALGPRGSPQDNGITTRGRHNRFMWGLPLRRRQAKLAVDCPPALRRSFALLPWSGAEPDLARGAKIKQTVRKLPEFGVKQGEERAVRESERLGLIGRLTRPKRRPGRQCAQIEPRNPPQAATAAVMASTPRMLSARRKL